MEVSAFGFRKLLGKVLIFRGWDTCFSIASADNSFHTQKTAEWGL
jgi:hypothetical protein